MLTKNFYAVQAAVMGNTIVSDVTDFNGNVTTVSPPSSNNYFRVLNFLYRVAGFTGPSVVRPGVVFSSSGTIPNADDTTIESILTSETIEVQRPDKTTVSQSEGYTEYSATFGVTSRKMTTITAMGFVGGFGYEDSTSAANLLLDHTLLDDPITLQPGESKQITYTIRFNYPQPPAV